MKTVVYIFLIFQQFFSCLALMNGKSLPSFDSQPMATAIIAVGYQAPESSKGNTKYVVACGGIAIHMNYALTSAGCIVDIKEAGYKVAVGQNAVKIALLVWNLIIEAHIMEGYIRQRKFVNDMAILKTPRIFIRDQPYIDLLPDVSRMQATIWGFGLKGDFSFPTEMQYANLSLWSSTACSKKALAVGISSSEIRCAATDGTGMSFGDIGAPLVNAEGTIVFGIGSYFYADRSCRTFQYFNAIAPFKNFLQKIMPKDEIRWYHNPSGDEEATGGPWQPPGGRPQVTLPDLPAPTTPRTSRGPTAKRQPGQGKGRRPGVFGSKPGTGFGAIRYRTTRRGNRHRRPQKLRQEKPNIGKKNRKRSTKFSNSGKNRHRTRTFGDTLWNLSP